MKGWVYIITNPALPGILKVGYSMKDPKLRASELNNTGIPHRYVVDYEILVNEPRNIERRTHQKLSGYREGKEWFHCKIEEAIAAIKESAQGQIINESFESIRYKDAEIIFQKKMERKQNIRLLETKINENLNQECQKWKSKIDEYKHLKEEAIIEKYNKLLDDNVSKTKKARLYYSLLLPVGLGIILYLYDSSFIYDDFVGFMIVSILYGGGMAAIINKWMGKSRNKEFVRKKDYEIESLKKSLDSKKYLFRLEENSHYDIYVTEIEKLGISYSSCVLCDNQIDKFGRCRSCGHDLRSNVFKISDNMGINLKKVTDNLPAFIDRDDPDFFVLLLTKIIKYIKGIYPHIIDEDEEIRMWQGKAQLYFDPPTKEFNDLLQSLLRK